MDFLNNRPGPSGTSTLGLLKPLVDRSTDIRCLSGYLSPDALNDLGVRGAGTRTSVRILIGMAIEDGLYPELLPELTDLDARLAATGGGIRICAEPCHSKYWIGELVGAPWTLLGSSNVSRQGMYLRREANLLDSTGTVATMVAPEFEELWSSGKACSVAPAKARRVPASRPATAIASATDPDTDTAKVRISLVAASGEVQGGDGLNWWRNSSSGAVRRGRPDEACIPIRAGNYLAIEAVLGALNEGRVFHARTSSGRTFDLMLQGSGAAGRAKQIASRGDLEILGNWILRDVLALSPGERVTANILRDRLGTTDLTITRVGHAIDGVMELYLEFERD